MDLSIYLQRAVRGFSRYNKYTLGTELRTISLDIVRLIIRGNNTEGDDAEFGVAHLGLKAREGHRGMVCSAGFPRWFEKEMITRILKAGLDMGVVDQAGLGQYVRERYLGVHYKVSQLPYEMAGEKGDLR